LPFVTDFCPFGTFSPHRRCNHSETKGNALVPITHQPASPERAKQHVDEIKHNH
jgi:hypothetical protein